MQSFKIQFSSCGFEMEDLGKTKWAPSFRDFSASISLYPENIEEIQYG